MTNSRIEFRGGSEEGYSSPIYLYNDAHQLNTVLSDGTYNSYFNAFSSNVGIGTTSPQYKLARSWAGGLSHPSQSSLLKMPPSEPSGEC
jgi:hypothetical protein